VNVVLLAGGLGTRPPARCGGLVFLARDGVSLEAHTMERLAKGGQLAAYRHEGLVWE
jgi:hypothetical protein